MTEGKIGLFGAHQRWNAAVAAQVPKLLSSRAPFDRISQEDIFRGLAQVQWPGRFQQVDERFVLDGAHNPASALALVETWRERFPRETATIIIGAMRDKDVAAVCATLASIAHKFIPVAVGNPRSCTTAELSAILRQQAPTVTCEEAVNLNAALLRVQREPSRVLICGSLFLVGEALSALGLAADPHELSSQ